MYKLHSDNEENAYESLSAMSDNFFKKSATISTNSQFHALFFHIRLVHRGIKPTRFIVQGLIAWRRDTEGLLEYILFLFAGCLSEISHPQQSSRLIWTSSLVKVIVESSLAFIALETVVTGENNELGSFVYIYAVCLFGDMSYVLIAIHFLLFYILMVMCWTSWPEMTVTKGICLEWSARYTLGQKYRNTSWNFEPLWSGISPCARQNLQRLRT